MGENTDKGEELLDHSINIEQATTAEIPSNNPGNVSSLPEKAILFYKNKNDLE
ncbi:MAG TPA: hypothetical protein VK498_06420 [Ferruginibacter sp.]|nr:hypothetical protein [Ferruginibacter sp.]